MERVIKFRAFDVESCEMVFSEQDNMRDFYFDLNSEKSLSLFMPQEEDFAEKRNAVIMQFTGLLDKNGVEIYEGDILECQDRLVKVIWHEHAAQFDTLFIKYLTDLSSNGITNQEWKYRSSVIGNIHQNPELL